MSPYIERLFDPLEILNQKSCFLFGPRQTGKSMLIRHQLGEYKVYNLLDQDMFLRLSRNPGLIREQLDPDDEIIVIDEIQKLPLLLNEVHLMIEEYGIRFLLTGSSARSLRKKGVNLLGGRAWRRALHPFVYPELGELFRLERCLDTGVIPSVYLSESPRQELTAYAGNYLREEVAAEAVVRNIGAFSRFLEIAALCHGQMINFTLLANDAQVPVTTVREYFQILVDTLIAFVLPAFKQSRKRKAISTSKYYLFDIGLVRSLQGRTGLAQRTTEFGEAFESFIFQELSTYCSYRQIDNLHYWRSKSQFEVDFVLANRTAIEVKASQHVTHRDLKGLKALQEEELMADYLLVSMDPLNRVVDGIRLMSWEEFLKRLWEDEFTP